MKALDNRPAFKYGIGTYDFMLRVIELVAGEDHGISLGTTTEQETWIELHCSLPRELRQRLRRVFYPSLLVGDRNERRRAMRGKVNRHDVYASLFLPHESLAHGDRPFAIMSLGDLVDLLVERRQLLEARKQGAT